MRVHNRQPGIRLWPTLGGWHIEPSPRARGADLDVEIGKHAAESGLDLKAYAEQAGKARQSLQHKVYGWRVLAAVPDIGHADARESWSSLAEIHAAPQWLWQALARAMLAESGLDLKAYAEQAGKVRETLKYKLHAWRVYSVAHVSHDTASDAWRNLAEIHAAPQWLWQALARSGRIG